MNPFGCFHAMSNTSFLYHKHCIGLHYKVKNDVSVFLSATKIADMPQGNRKNRLRLRRKLSTELIFLRFFFFYIPNAVFPVRRRASSAGGSSEASSIKKLVLFVKSESKQAKNGY